MATDQIRRSTRDWVYGAEAAPPELAKAMTDEQAHRLKALCWQRGERFDTSLTEDEAERRIAELEARG
ncbi:MAG: DUF3072 domain-containing protein [Rhodospirillaceae bacterium]|nr:DUF3072 domain-containing protein [Rhodospirillales bacterium]